MLNSKIVTVNVTKPYDIVIGKNNLINLIQFIKKSNIKRICIFTDENVWKYYNKILTDLLSFNNIYYENFIYKSGESSKSIENYLKGIEFLTQNKFRRSDAVVAFGGGVIGDLSGFIASTYLRGMNFIQIPTTLLSGIDSSVGGKTAINTEYGKNLIGTFKQPDYVICDSSLFETMEKFFFLDGVAETIKYSILSDNSLFNELNNIPLTQKDNRIVDIIEKCVNYKKLLVEKDEQDNNERRLLNLGHTIGHCIEKLSNYKISHGHAVSIGISYISKISFSLSLIDEITSKKIIDCLKVNGLPTSTTFTAKEIFNVSTLDKKCIDEQIDIVLIKNIGDCFIKKISLNEWFEYLKSVIDTEA